MEETGLGGSSDLRRIHIQILCSARAILFASSCGHCMQPVHLDCLIIRDRCLPLKSDLGVTLFLIHHLQNGDKQHFCLTRVLWEQMKLMAVKHSENHESMRGRQSIKKGLSCLSEQKQFGQIFVFWHNLLNLQCSS